MRDRALRVVENCRRIAEMTEVPGCITRQFLTPPVRDVHEFLRERMQSLGMATQVDAVGNLRGIWRPPDAGLKRLLMGSHIDSVPNAGAYDGVLGVVIALEWVQIAQENGIPIPIEVIAFSEEEGVRFGVPFLGSRAIAGKFDVELLRLLDQQGVSLKQAIQAFGLDPRQVDQARIDDDVFGFVEVHIEQGPILESMRLSLAAVTEIAGQTRGTMTFIGRANHAGTTPMLMRRDALAGAAEWVGTIEDIALRTDGLAATAGKIVVEPNAGNVIPGKAVVSLDCRHADDRLRNVALRNLLIAGSEIASQRGLSVEWSEELNQGAVPMEQSLTALMLEAIRDADLPGETITSGAGHDAMIMASRFPAAMLLLRSPGGISHHPSETVFVEDIEAALRVGKNFLQRLAGVVG